MKSTLFTLLSVAALSSSALASFTLNIAKTTEGTSTSLRRRDLSKRASISESLVNNFTGGRYIASVSVGTPPQTLSLDIDTGSSDVWMIASTADFCTETSLQAEYGDGCTTPFNPNKSSTFQDVGPGEFEIEYMDYSGAEGDYITDTLSIGGATVTNLTMGLGFNVTLGYGLLGIGYDTNEAALTPYPSIIDQMVTEGLINTKAYSLYLDDLDSSTGSIIFGGIDTDKFYGELVSIPIQPNVYESDDYNETSLLNFTDWPSDTASEIYASFSVPLTSFYLTNQTGEVTKLSNSTFNDSVVLDSGTMLTYLPQDLVDTLYEVLGAYDDSIFTGNVYVPCSLRDKEPGTIFTYGFPGVNISIPVHELVFDLTGLFSGTPNYLPFADPCALGVLSDDGYGSTLGDTFLRSAYVVYDLDNNLVGLAQTNFQSTKANVVEIEKGATAIPTATGVSGAIVLPTTGTSTGTSTATGTGATGTQTGSKKSGAGLTVPALDGRGLMVLCLSAIWAVVGGTWFLA